MATHQGNKSDAVPSVEQMTQILDENSNPGVNNVDDEIIKVTPALSSRKRKAAAPSEPRSTTEKRSKKDTNSTSTEVSVSDKTPQQKQHEATTRNTDSVEIVSHSLTPAKKPQVHTNGHENKTDEKNGVKQNVNQVSDNNSNSNGHSHVSNSTTTDQLKLYWTTETDSKEFLRPAMIVVAKDEEQARQLADRELKREGLKPYDEKKYTFASTDFKQSKPIIIDMSVDNTPWTEIIPYENEAKLINPSLFYCTEVELPSFARNKMYVPVFVLIADDSKKARDLVMHYVNKKAKAIFDLEQNQPKKTMPVTITSQPILFSRNVSKISTPFITRTLPFKPNGGGFFGIKNFSFNRTPTQPSLTFIEQGKNAKTFPINNISISTPSATMLYNGQLARFQHNNIQ